jgi:hypothetical protein
MAVIYLIVGRGENHRHHQDPQHFHPKDILLGTKQEEKVYLQLHLQFKLPPRKSAHRQYQQALVVTVKQNKTTVQG